MDYLIAPSYHTMLPIIDQDEILTPVDGHGLNAQSHALALDRFQH